MATVTTSSNLITWSDRYSVGIARIDAEHRKLVDLVNELYAAILACNPTSVTAKVLDGLASYTVSHFTSEEGLMKRHAYPGYIQHKAEHDKLVAQVKQLQQDLRAGKATVSQEVMSFLQSWLIGHILGMDKKYTSHLKAAGVS
jgi:hemerythrin-like metal-binding protein